MQKAKQILAHCNTFTQDEVESSFLGEIDLEEESAKRAKEVIEKGMFGVERSGNIALAHISKVNNISLIIVNSCSGLKLEFEYGNCSASLDDTYIIDKTDIITIMEFENSHLFFNKFGVFYVDDSGRYVRFFI